MARDTVVLVTGAGSGLGRAIVDRFRAEGARVGVLEIDAAKADAVRAVRCTRRRSMQSSSASSTAPSCPTSNWTTR